MRLLEITNEHKFRLCEDKEDDAVPECAILSHTWGPDSEEVTYKDLVEETGKHKSGHRKLEFCATQAHQDGIKYFWVDTCCIDKSNSVELNTAITSMFRWYQHAAKCYVYLRDVSIAPAISGSSIANEHWLSEFRDCRWMKRGWTLQELLAPAAVIFYDRAGVRLGDKISLGRHIRDVSGIPAEALDGRLLSSFSIEERFSWQENRTTKKPEDKAYSLMGICGVSMVPIYGEGRKAALARLRREIEDDLKGPKRQDFSIPFGDTEAKAVEHFVAREQELETTHTSLTGDGHRRTVILHGLGGIGKTQLAAAYARRYRDSYSAIFWLNIQDKSSIDRSFERVAKRIVRYHPSARWLSGLASDATLEDYVAAVNAWLSEAGNTRWLAIYDNYDNPKIRSNNHPDAIDIQEFLPDASQGSLIITTRSPQVPGGTYIPVKKLANPKDSAEILSRMSRRPLSIDDSDVSALIEKLDGLPLALATAGAYLNQVNVSVASYLEMYNVLWLELHERDPGLDSYEDRTLYSTWRISFDRIEQQNELSAKLLGLWCYFNNHDLWFELLCEAGKDSIPWIKELTTNLHVFTEAMRLLCNYSFVDTEKPSEDSVESGGYSIHSCVHTWSLHVLNRRWNAALARLALDVVARHAPETNSARPWVTQRRLLPHANRCFRYMQEGLVNQDDIELSLHAIGGLYADQGKMEEAEEMYMRALKGYEKAWGPKHTSTLDTVNNLANLYADQGKMEEAEEMYMRALKGYEKAWGPKHTSTLRTVNNLGLLYANQGKMEEAEEIYMRVLKGYKKAWGPEHTSTLDTVNNLAILYANQGKMQEAEEMYMRALKGKEKAWGPEHTSTLDTVNNLANLYANQGKMEEAEEMYMRALKGKEKAWGPEHTSTLDTVNNLGLLYANQGKMEEAEEMYMRALKGYEKAWGPKHTSTLGTVNNLANLYANQGKMEEAEEMYMRALKGYKNAWGPEHTSTLDTVNNLAILYANQGKMEEAEEMCMRALKGKEKALGPEHTSTLDTVNNLANLYANQGKMEEAEEMYIRALKGKAKAWGPEHTSTLNTVNNLAILYKSQGKMEEAEEMYMRALKGYEKAWGPKHTSTLDTVNNLAILYADQGKIEEAEEMYMRALKGYEKAWGPEHTSTLRTVNNLANLYADQGKMEEAEEIYMRALKGYKKAWGPEHTSTLATVNNLAILYADQGKMQEAEEMYMRALKGYKKAWGPEHTSTLNTVNNLANLYADQGKMEEAEEIYIRALKGKEKAWGPEHTSTLNTVNNLAILYKAQGKMEEAEEMYMRALKGYEKAWGPKHTSTLDTVNNLAVLYADQGKMEEAEKMLSSALQGYRSLRFPPQAHIDALERKLASMQKTNNESTSGSRPHLEVEPTYPTFPQSSHFPPPHSDLTEQPAQRKRRWKVLDRFRRQ